MLLLVFASVLPSVTLATLGNLRNFGTLRLDLTDIDIDLVDVIPRYQHHHLHLPSQEEPEYPLTDR